MDDKTLLRPLFRQKALHVKQIKTNSIPQYAVGGIMYGLGQLVGRAGPWAARAWRGAKAGAGQEWQETNFLATTKRNPAIHFATMAGREDRGLLGSENLPFCRERVCRSFDHKLAQ